MTEKRFDYEGKYVTMDNGVFVIAQTINDAELIAKTLNGLYEENQQLIERNQRQYERLKEITDLMYARDWEALEQIVEDWEQAEELLQSEMGTYGDGE